MLAPRAGDLIPATIVHRRVAHLMTMIFSAQDLVRHGRGCGSLRASAPSSEAKNRGEERSCSRSLHIGPYGLAELLSLAADVAKAPSIVAWTYLPCGNLGRASAAPIPGPWNRDLRLPYAFEGASGPGNPESNASAVARRSSVTRALTSSRPASYVCKSSPCACGGSSLPLSNQEAAISCVASGGAVHGRENLRFTSTANAAGLDLRLGHSRLPNPARCNP